jgi:hypothetical protein
MTFASCRPCEKSGTLRQQQPRSRTCRSRPPREQTPHLQRSKTSPSEIASRLTTQVLQQGRADPDAIREVASAVLGRTSGGAAPAGAKARELFAEAVTQFDDALVKSAAATHDALQQLASREQDFTDNDLKAALVSLRKLDEDCVALSKRLAGALNVNLRREMTEIAAHAQNLGVEASARAASMMGDFTSNMSAGSGLATVRGAGANIAMLASGVLAGIADALRANTEAKEGK